MKILISLLFGLALMFASFQSKGATPEGCQFQNLVVEKMPASKLPGISSHNPYADLLMILQQKKSSVRILLTNVDGYLNGAQFFMQSECVEGYKLKTLSPSYLQPMGLLLIFPKHYFL